MTMQVRRDADHPRRPWRNGGGLTTELVACPEHATADSDFDWRVSLAEVARSGDFSAFPGVDRVITLLDGPPMTLRTGDAEHTLRPFEPYEFTGDEPVRGEVTAPTRDLNVMTRRGRALATVTVTDLSTAAGHLDLPAAAPLVVVILTGAVGAVGDGATAPLHPGDVLTSHSPVRLTGQGRVAVIRIDPHEPSPHRWRSHP